MGNPNAIHPTSRETNPFDSSFELSTAQTVKVCVLGVLLAPLRILLMCITTGTGILVGQLCSQRRGHNEDYQPFSSFSRGLQAFVRFLARVCLFLAGFYRVKFTGQLADPSDAPITVIAPHTTWMDVFVFGHLGMKSVVARAEAEENSIVAPLFRCFKPICVTRTSKDSRVKTSEAIVRRAKSGQWPATAIFPEGTCSNGTSLISFKIGAFSPGVPVQPILVKYKNKMDFLSWAFKGANGLKSAMVMYSQFVNFMEIEALPVYYPSAEEKEDPHLFAINVRAYMAERLGIPVSDYSFEDGLLVALAHDLGLPADIGLVKFEEIKSQLGFDLNMVKMQLKQFASIDSDRDGFITKSDLAAFCHIAVDTGCMERIFSFYNQKQTGKISFREFLLGRHEIVSKNDGNLIAEVTALLIDDDNADDVTIEKFKKVWSVVGMDEAGVEAMFAMFCEPGQSTLSRESLKRLIAYYPELRICIRDLHGC